jgi:TonB family protein
VTLLLSSALRASFIVGAAWMATRVLGSASADVRRRIWVAALCAIATLPVAIWFAARAAPSAFRLEMPPSVNALTAPPAGLAVSWLAVAWIAGAMIVLGRLTAGLVTIWRTTRAAWPAHDGLSSVGNGVAYVNDIMAPVTWGVARPIVLLPDYMRSWPDDRRALLVRHERAHIQQHDWVWQMVAQAVCAVFWFQPLVWLAASAFARESERAADDRVLASGADAPGYAAELLAIARIVQGARFPAAVAIVGRSSLERRVRDILDGTRARGAATRTSRFAVVMALVVGVVASSVPLAAMQGSRAYKVGDEGVTPPVPVSKTKAEYTPDAMRRKIEGSVILQAIVTEQGLADSIVVTQSLDDGLDAQAVEALSGWRFEPGRKDGAPVPVEISVEVRFVLR